MSTLKSSKATKTVQNPALKKEAITKEPNEQPAKKATVGGEPWVVNTHVRLQTAEGRKRAQKRERIEERKRTREADSA